jgi:hypothetical protein
MIELLQNYIDTHTIETTGGKESNQREAFINFYVSNHGIDVETIKKKINRGDVRTAATPRILGFLDGNMETTAVGDIFLKKCIDSKRILHNQYKKWHWTNHVNKKGDAAHFDIYPYWVILESLLECRINDIHYITKNEYMLFISVIKNRNEIKNNIEILKYIRNNPIEAKELYDEIPDKDNFFLRFSKSGFHGLLGDCLEHITYDSKNETVSLTDKTTDYFKNQINYFYEKYDKYTDYNSVNYLNFLRSNTVDNTYNIFPMAKKEITLDIIKEVSGTIKNDFPYKNLLLKGVPGTGKSKEVEDKIRENIFGTKDGSNENECLPIGQLLNTNIIRINVHSGLSNSELMQGIGVITTANNEIKYHEKQGLILEHIARAILNPSLPYCVILEEIQENSLNRLIGDLIFLIEENRRVTFKKDHPELIGKPVDYQLVSDLTIENANDNKTKLPSLVESGKEIFLCIPNNLYFFCTSNYRDDRKIMEDNLLRRFDVLEVFPDSSAIEHSEVRTFFEDLNIAILNKMAELNETHPDHFLCGHVIWMKVNDIKSFSRALNKLIIDFKDLKELDWDTFKEIIEKTSLGNVTEKSYNELIKNLQDCYYYGSKSDGDIIDKIFEITKAKDQL